MMGILLVASVLAASAIAVVARRNGVALWPPARGRHPESLTADLPAAAEEYLAWLADHHWPDDEYLELERRWRAESRDEPAVPPMCPGCGRAGDDVWPCAACGQMLHSTCGGGMSRRQVAKPYRTRDMSSETVVAEWTCTGCSAVVGLDVEEPAGSDSDRGDEESGRSRR